MDEEKDRYEKQMEKMRAEKRLSLAPRSSAPPSYVPRSSAPPSYAPPSYAESQQINKNKKG